MPNIFLFHGDDSFSALQTAKHWDSEFEKKYGEGSVESLEGGQLSAQQITEAIRTVPFFSEKKLVLIKDFFRDAPAEELKNMAEILKKDYEADHFILVFVEHQGADKRTGLFKTIKKIGEVKDYSLKDPQELASWISARFQKKGKNIGHREARELAEQVGPNMWQLNSEIEKLDLYSGEQPVTTQAIESLVSPNLTASIFKLTDSIATKDRTTSLKTLNTLLESGESIIQIIFMVARHVRIMIQIKDGLDHGLSVQQIIKKTGEHPYAVNKAAQQCRNFEVSKLKEIFQKLLQIDTDMKSGVIKIATEDVSELRLPLEKIMVEACA